MSLLHQRFFGDQKSSQRMAKGCRPLVLLGQADAVACPNMCMTLGHVIFSWTMLSDLSGRFWKKGVDICCLTDILIILVWRLSHWIYWKRSTRSKSLFLNRVRFKASWQQNRFEEAVEVLCYKMERGVSTTLKGIAACTVLQMHESWPRRFEATRACKWKQQCVLGGLARFWIL